MFSKILAGALGLGVVAVGGVMFHEYGSCPMSGCKMRNNTEAVSAETPSCCSDLSRAGAISCCSDEATEAVSTEATPETLTIAPREVVK